MKFFKNEPTAGKEKDMRRAQLTVMFLVVVLILVQSGFAQRGKEIPLFRIPSDVTDNLGETRKMLNDVQEKMATKVNDLDTLMKTYKETCKGDQNDAGCVEMVNQIKQKYLGVLKTLEAEMPKIKGTIDQTAEKLGRTLKAKTRSKSVKDLYYSVSKKRALPKSTGPLSKRLNDMVKLIRRAGQGGGNISPLEMSLQTQADLIASSQALTYLESEITRQRLFVETAVSFGDLSPMIGSVMGGVAEIFDYDISETGDSGYEDVVGGDDSGGEWFDE